MEGAETMKVAVSDLVANPYRKILKYPIRREKVDHLKSSIGDTGFWDNILARKVGDEYQIAYGHHRLTALRELDIKEVDIPVKDLDDSIMIKIMANENMEEWESNTSVINETILTVKEYLARSRGIAVGEPEILKFLGSSWKQETVRNALATIKDDDKSIDREAVEVFPNPFHAQAFRRELKKPMYNDASGTPIIPREKQKKFAEKVKKEAVKYNPDEELTARGIKHAVFNLVMETAEAQHLEVPALRPQKWELFEQSRSTWQRVLLDLMELTTRHGSRELSMENREQIEEKYIKRIETLIKRWRDE